MKLFKKLLSYIIAFTMVLSLATLLGGNVHAAEGTAAEAAGHTITIDTTSTNHTYEAYRIFKGTYLKSGTSEYLGEIDWDTDYVDTTNAKSGKTLIDALKEKKEFENVTNAKGVAEVLSATDNRADNSTAARDFALIVSKYLKTTAALTSSIKTGETKPTITVPAEGYYLVKDHNDDQSTTENKAYTRIIVKVVGQDVTVTPKTETPTVSKTVQDNDDGDKTTSPARDGDNYGKTADHSIGEVFNYKLVATIPNTNTSVNDYQGAYKLVFHDTMSKGLTYKGVTSVKVSDSIHEEVDVTGYTVTKEDGTELGNSAAATTSDLAWKVTIANLKDTKGLDLTKALTVTVIYEAALNEDAKIATPAPAHKLHNDNEVQLEYSNNPNAEGEGTPTGKTSKDTAYVFTYELDNTKVDKADHNVKLDGAEFELQKDGKALTFTYDSGYDSGKGAYRVDPSSDATTLVSGHGNTNTNNPTGIFNMIGLDAGVYTLHETKAPDGYNTMADVTITIEAEHKLEETPDVTLRFKKDNSTIDGNAFLIENGKGSTLPSTGGMGTTLLYVAGGILVACAAAYVVLNKKRA